MKLIKQGCLNPMKLIKQGCLNPMKFIKQGWLNPMKSIKQGCQCRQGNRILNNSISNATFYDFPIKEKDKAIPIILEKRFVFTRIRFWTVICGWSQLIGGGSGMKNDYCRRYLCENYSFHGLKGPHRVGRGILKCIQQEVEEGCTGGKESEWKEG